MARFGGGGGGGGGRRSGDWVGTWGGIHDQDKRIC